MLDKHKVAVITGASKGIGAQLLRGFREIGYGVVANSRSISTSDAGGDEMILAADGDVASPDTAERIVRGAMQRFGRIDTLVNNAGVFIPKPFIDYSGTDFATMTAVNLAGFFHVTQKAASCMLRAGSGHIVNITATIAEQPVASLPAALAALTKGGLNAVARSLAIEYAGRGIRVNAVGPGAVVTPINRAWIDNPKAKAEVESHIPMGRAACPEEIASVFAFLASDDASYITGQTLYACGGLTLYPEFRVAWSSGE